MSSEVRTTLVFRCDVMAGAAQCSAEFARPLDPTEIRIAMDVHASRARAEGWAVTVVPRVRHACPDAVSVCPDHVEIERYGSWTVAGELTIAARAMVESFAGPLMPITQMREDLT